MEFPSVDPSLLSGAIVVVRGERRTRRGARDMERLRRLVDEVHMRHAHVLRRQAANWDEAQSLSKSGIDLISVVAEERDAGSDG